MNLDSHYLTDYTLKGTYLDILVYPNPILRQIAEPVESFDSELEELCMNMLFTMYKTPGIGLAAPQVGVSQRVIVMDVNYSREKSQTNDDYIYSNFQPLIFINPVFKDKEGTQIYKEGCLSLPGVFEDIERAKSVTIEYQDLTGAQKILQADELLSICIQHEHDHLEGKVFLDYLSKLKHSFYQKKLMKEKKRRGQ